LEAESTKKRAAEVIETVAKLEAKIATCEAEDALR
jgi:hypothetical protein